MTPQDLPEKTICCNTCNGTGMHFVGAGRRLPNYPWAEKTVSTICHCAAGRALRDENKLIHEREANAREYADAMLAEIDKDIVA